MTSNNIKTTILSAGICLLTLTMAAFGQKATPTPTPAPADENYTISSSIEIGVRGLSVHGDNDKYRSDLNYRPGVRLFDSSFNVDAKKGGVFNHAFVQTSGWGGDPSGFFRGNMDKSGTYRFSSTVRRNHYFNNLLNFAPTWSQPVSTDSQHRFNTVRNLGDFDLVIRPDSEKLRFSVGYSYNRSNGPGMYNLRWPSFTGTVNPASIRGEEFNVLTNWKTNADDFRAGVEGKLLGFNMGLNYGYRTFHDYTSFTLPAPNGGNDPSTTSGSAVTSYDREYRTRGNTNFLNFFVQRSFADKLDFAGRLVYSVANSYVNETDLGVGRTFASTTTAAILLDNDTVSVLGKNRRPQTRGDVGFTYRATKKFRVSETFSFDQFNGSGGNNFFETLISRNGAGAARPNDFSNTSYWRLTSYHKYTNLLEADVDVNRKFSFNAGYRWSHRREGLNGLPNTFNTTEQAFPYPEVAENTTKAGIFGVRIRPTKYWGILADAEFGSADSVFTRTENNKYRAFRVRSIARMKQFTLNFSAIIRNNTNPGFSEAIYSQTGSTVTLLVPERQADATSRIRNVSTSLDWSPNEKWSLSVGHTFDHQTSHVDVIIPIGTPINSSAVGTVFTPGISEYYVRDNFFFFDLTAHPMNRVTLFASYRIDNDAGQGSRVSTRPQDLISSYPMRFQTPEMRLSFKISKRIDWDLGYKYYSYRENLTYTPFGFGLINGSTTLYSGGQRYPQQNYIAHMPYMSLRFYFGRSADARR
jgi:hypothetical protein